MSSTSLKHRIILLAFCVIGWPFPSIAQSIDSDEKPRPSDTKDLVTPQAIEGGPEAGKRFLRFAPEYEGTGVYHAIYLPTDWTPDGSYPVLIEYTGNRFPACGSTGRVEDANLGYGLTGGERFIWVSMPYVDQAARANATTWWGDRQATVEYCKRNVPRICSEFGGDPSRVFLCGFSRGAIAVSYIGLADDQIASLWRGFIAHDHFDGQREWSYAKSDRPSALRRLARLAGRPVLVCGGGNDFLLKHQELGEFTFVRPQIDTIFRIPEGNVIHPHTDLWMHRDSRDRVIVRNWLESQLKGERAPGSHSPTQLRGEK